MRRHSSTVTIGWTWEPEDAEVIGALTKLRPMYPCLLDQPPFAGERPFASLRDLATATAAIERAGAALALVVGLGVRPEHLTTQGTENRIEVGVTFVENLGSTTHAYCDFPGMEEALTCELGGGTRVRAGTRLSLCLPAEKTYLFNATGQAMRRHVAQEL